MSTKPLPAEELSSDELAKWAKFDAEIQKALDDVEAGRVYDADEVFGELDRELEAMIAARR